MEPTTVYELGQGHARHRRPFFSPDGNHFLFYVFEYGEGGGSLYVGSLDGNEPKRIMDGRGLGVRYAGGYLFAVHDYGALVAYPFDLDRLDVVGDALPLASHNVGAAWSVSDEVAIIRQEPDTPPAGFGRLVLVDREGRERAQIGEPGDYFAPRLSPDGSSVAVEIHNERGGGDVELLDLGSGRRERLSFAPDHHNSAAVWSPDGTQIAFYSGRVSPTQVFVKARDGATEVKQVSGFATPASPTDWYRHRRFIRRRHPRQPLNATGSIHRLIAQSFSLVGRVEKMNTVDCPFTLTPGPSGTVTFAARGQCELISADNGGFASARATVRLFNAFKNSLGFKNSILIARAGPNQVSAGRTNPGDSLDISLSGLPAGAYRYRGTFAVVADGNVLGLGRAICNTTFETVLSGLPENPFEAGPGIDKDITFGPGDPSSIDVIVEAGKPMTTQYQFDITYKNPGRPAVVILDTVPAEWQVAEVGGNPIVNYLHPGPRASGPLRRRRKNGANRSLRRSVCLPAQSPGAARPLVRRTTSMRKRPWRQRSVSRSPEIVRL